MSTYSRSWVTVLTLGFGRSSLDLALVVVSVAATFLAVVLGAPVALRAPLAVLLVSFVPGYVVTIALFPAVESAAAVSEREPGRTVTITTMDRVVLSVGTSLAVVALAGVAVAASPAPISPESLLDAVAFLVLAITPVAYYRRRQVPAAARFAPFEGAVLDGHDRAGSLGFDPLRTAVVLSVLFAGGAVALSIGATGGAGVTEFYFEGAAGDATTGQPYPINMTAGQPESVTLAVGNHEGSASSYRVVGDLQVLSAENGTAAVAAGRRLVNRTVSVPADETRRIDTSVTPTTPGEYRLRYELYRTDASVRDDPYSEIHLRVDVDEPSAAIEATTATEPEPATTNGRTGRADDR